MDHVDSDLDVNNLMSLLKGDNGNDKETSFETNILKSETFAPLSGIITMAADYLNVALKFVNILNNIFF